VGSVRCFFGPDLAQDRNALNAASGGLARANRIPHSHTATMANCMLSTAADLTFSIGKMSWKMSGECHIMVKSAAVNSQPACPGRYDLGQLVIVFLAIFSRYLKPDWPPPLTISVWYIHTMTTKDRLSQLANRPKSLSPQSTPLSLLPPPTQPYHPCPPLPLVRPFTQHAFNPHPDDAENPRPLRNTSRPIIQFLVHHTRRRFTTLLYQIASTTLALYTRFPQMMRSLS